MLQLTAGSDILHAIESSGVALYFRQSLWLYPAVEIIHIIGFSVLVGAACLFDLRLIGLARKLPVDECIRHLIRWARISFIAVLPSGIILFAVDATSIGVNPAFRIKLLLILLAGLNAALFHLYTARTIDDWNVGKMPPAGARIAGICSIILWFGVIACGRLIAYL